MGILTWWTAKESDKSSEEQKGYVSTDGGAFTRSSPLQEPTPPFILEKFPEVLEGYLNQQEHSFSKKRCLNALETAQNTSEYLSDDNKAALIMALIGKEEAFMTVRSIRWRNGLYCPKCGSTKVKIVAQHEGLVHYRCLDCEARAETSQFTDLTDINIAHDTQSITKWVLLCYLKNFCSISKISKLLKLSLQETTLLMSMIQQDRSFSAPNTKNLTKQR